jgi:hypothetical protein
VKRTVVGSLVISIAGTALLFSAAPAAQAGPNSSAKLVQGINAAQVGDCYIDPHTKKNNSYRLKKVPCSNPRHTSEAYFVGSAGFEKTTSKRVQSKRVIAKCRKTQMKYTGRNSWTPFTGWSAGTPAEFKGVGDKIMCLSTKGFNKKGRPIPLGAGWKLK